MTLLKELWAEVRELISMIDWWVATKMLVIFLLALGILVWVIRWVL